MKKLVAIRQSVQNLVLGIRLTIASSFFQTVLFTAFAVASAWEIHLGMEILEHRAVFRAPGLEDFGIWLQIVTAILVVCAFWLGRMSAADHDKPKSGGARK